MVDMSGLAAGLWLIFFAGIFVGGLVMGLLWLIFG